jgi:hypothetical protein
VTPSMHLSALILSFTDRPYAEAIKHALNTAFSLGHEFGIDRSADVVDQCNMEGPYNAIGAAKRIRALRVVVVQSVRTVDSDPFPLPGYDFHPGDEA